MRKTALLTLQATLLDMKELARISLRIMRVHTRWPLGTWIAQKEFAYFLYSVKQVPWLHRGWNYGWMYTVLLCCMSLCYRIRISLSGRWMRSFYGFSWTLFYSFLLACGQVCDFIQKMLTLKIRYLPFLLYSRFQYWTPIFIIVTP